MATKRQDEVVNIRGDATSLLKAVGRAGSAVRALAAAVAGAVGVQMVAAWVKLYRVQEQAEVRLIRALKASGQFSRQYHQQLVELSKRVQRLTVVGDEVALGVIQNLVAVGRVSREDIEKTTFAVIGLAHQQGRSVERMQRTIVTSLNQIANENITSLGEAEKFLSSAQIRIVRDLKKTEGGIAAQSQAIQFLHERYGEFARSVEGSTDSWEDLSNAWFDLGERAGELAHIILGPLTKGFADVTDEAGNLVKSGYLTKIGDFMDSLADKAIGIATGFRKVWLELRRIVLERGLKGHREGAAKDSLRAELAAVKAELDELWKPRERVVTGRTTDPDRVSGRVIAPTAEEEGAGAGGGPDPQRVAQRLAAVKREIALNQMALEGQLKARRDYHEKLARLDAQAEAARLELQGSANAALLEGTLTAIGQKRELAKRAFDDEMRRDAEERAVRMEALKREEGLLSLEYEAILKGRSSLFADYQRELAELDAEWNEARLRLTSERDQAELERIRRNIEQRKLIADEAYLRDLEEEEQRFADKQLREEERQRAKEEREAEALRREAEMKEKAFRDTVARESRYGALVNSIVQAFEKQKQLTLKTSLGILATLQSSGNKRLAKIGKAAAAARLLVDQGTKPFEAYAKTSAAYPAPWGPALGAAHAAAVAAQIGIGLAAIGSSGGGGGGANVPGSIDADRPADGPIASEVVDTREQRPIELHVTLEAEGRSLAEIVTDQIEHSDLG